MINASWQPTIRAKLRTHPDGMTAPELADVFGIARADVLLLLRQMPDAYIAEYVPGRPRANGGASRYAARWKVVVPPPHAKRPPKKI